MKNRYDFIYIFDCLDANPNGDPDAGNLPRLDIETGQGLVTDVCLKRKIRNFIHQTLSEQSGFKIFIQEKRPLNPLLDKACEATGIPMHLDSNQSRGKKEKEAVKSRPQTEIRTAQEWLCQHYYDIRAFGGVLSTGPNCGQIRGPIQLSFARSIDSIIPAEHCITRLTDVDKEEGEMGRKFTIPYGLYKCHGFVNPFLAAQTGFNTADLDVLFLALQNAFQFDQSSARPAGSMNPRALIVFKHDNPLGNAPSAKLLEGIRIERKPKVEIPRDFNDYQIRIPIELKHYCEDKSIEILQKIEPFLPLK